MYNTYRRSMSKREVFVTIKEANEVVDHMSTLSVDSKEYRELSEVLNDLLDLIIPRKDCFLCMSKRTGHYYVRFA